ncbi:MAG TPA: M20/M25/M40 family metallo-hydrolase [Phycisphaerales bacterium]|nr:M20/M25/M40 family metallo-hydrolase [Phycisphaerales bacterium]
MAGSALDWLAAHEPDSIARLLDWLRIPSVSTDPAYKPDVARAAEWAAVQLRESGLKVEVLPTGDPPGSGHPVVLAESPGAPGYKGPHVLFYGHYDVQPPEPLDLWESPPFEPVVKPASGQIGERIVARGAVDDKGQVATFLEALRAWKEATGEVAGGVRFTVLLEGEEESGSVNLERFVKQHAKRLGECDVCLISDTGMLGRGKPAITYGVRGLSYTEVILHAADQDLHSGMWGGRCPNPISELVKVLAQLWDKNRRVTIPGFYADVRELTPAERAEWKKLGFDQTDALRKIGLPPEADVGEAGYTPLEREWARPTAELNGIVGGYTGKGAKTVIPSHASAKVSFRLVADQDPAKITEAFFAWCRERTPPGCRWEFLDHSGGAPATVATDSPVLAAARRALKAASGADAALIKTGGSIPVAGMLKQQLGLETIFMGFGLDDDRVHSPNEKFELDCFRLGARAHALLIGELRSMVRA